MTTNTRRIEENQPHPNSLILVDKKRFLTTTKFQCTLLKLFQ